MRQQFHYISRVKQWRLIYIYEGTLLRRFIFYYLQKFFSKLCIGEVSWLCSNHFPTYTGTY